MYTNLSLWEVYISGRHSEPSGRLVIDMEGGSNWRKTGATASILATIIESNKGRLFRTTTVRLVLRNCRLKSLCAKRMSILLTS